MDIFSGFAPDLFGADAITLIVAIVSTVVTTGVRWARRITPITTRRKIIVDLLTGSVIYPFIVLMYSSFNGAAFKYIEGSKFSVALAGAVGLVFVVGELLLSCSHENHTHAPIQSGSASK
jgi:hypothetical protein